LQLRQSLDISGVEAI